MFFKSRLKHIIQIIWLLSLIIRNECFAFEIKHINSQALTSKNREIPSPIIQFSLRSKIYQPVLGRNSNSFINFDIFYPLICFDLTNFVVVKKLNEDIFNNIKFINGHTNYLHSGISPPLTPLV